jgi:hypothetical protein
LRNLFGDRPSLHIRPFSCRHTIERQTEKKRQLAQSKIEANANASRFKGKTAQICRGEECSFCRRTPELKDRDAIPLSLEGKKWFETELAVYKMIDLFLEKNCLSSKDLSVRPMSCNATPKSEWPISELDEQVDSIQTSLKQVLPSCNNGMSSLSFLALSEMNAHQINIKCSCSRVFVFFLCGCK